MRRRLVLSSTALFLAAAASGWLSSAPRQEDPSALVGLEANADRGRLVFHAGGCASCHAAEGASGDAMLLLTGGQAFPSAFGTFRASNISSDPVYGIGGWSAQDLLNAMRAGVSPDGRHYYPAFPYASYARAGAQDILDLHAYLMTLPASDAPKLPHETVFPFGIRRGIGLWKILNLSNEWVVTGDLSPVAERGRYLAEALGHCGECHTPRGPLGGSDRTRWLAGAPDPSGRGRVPGIAPGDLDWSEAEIAAYLEDGFTPDFDTAGGSMAAVIENTSRLTDEDRAAIAAYLKSMPAVE